MSSIEDRLRSLEEKLERIMIRIENIETLLRDTGKVDEAEVLRVMLKILQIASLPATRVEDAARRLLKLTRTLSSKGIRDDISKAIVEILAVEGPQTISSLTMRLREYRGKASRRIVRERLEQLRRIGIVEVSGTAKRKVIRLKR